MKSQNEIIKTALLSELETGKEFNGKTYNYNEDNCPSIFVANEKILLSEVIIPDAKGFYYTSPLINAMKTASAEMLEERYRLEDEEDMTDEAEIKTKLINYINSKY